MGWLKGIIALVIFEHAIEGEACPVWARAIGWALILTGFVVHHEE